MNANQLIQTNALLKLVKTFFPILTPHSQHQLLDSNPLPWNEKANVLPLCHPVDHQVQNFFDD
jgi:hypothetical protein